MAPKENLPLIHAQNQTLLKMGRLWLTIAVSPENARNPLSRPCQKSTSCVLGKLFTERYLMRCSAVKLLQRHAGKRCWGYCRCTSGPWHWRSCGTTETSTKKYPIYLNFLLKICAYINHFLFYYVQLLCF